MEKSACNESKKQWNRAQQLIAPISTYLNMNIMCVWIVSHKLVANSIGLLHKTRGDSEKQQTH